MRKSISKALLLIAMAFTVSMNSCRETKEDNAEEAVEDVKDAAEDVGDEVEDTADDVGDEIEDATDDNP